jgi:hypothetical protein
MTGLRSALARYLSMRQGLGYKYQHQARRLSQFVSFMEKHRATTITTKLAVAWATLPPDLSHVPGPSQTMPNGTGATFVRRAVNARRRWGAPEPFGIVRRAA